MKRRKTQATEDIFSILSSDSSALSSDMILSKANNLDRVTVYRVLNRFCEDGKAHKIVADDGKIYFALCNNCKDHHHDNHFHFRCLACGKLECLNETITPPVPKGYQVQNYNAIITGKCITCA